MTRRAVLTISTGLPRAESACSGQANRHLRPWARRWSMGGRYAPMVRLTILGLCGVLSLLIAGCVTETYTNPSVPGAGPTRVDVSAGGYSGSSRGVRTNGRPTPAPEASRPTANPSPGSAKSGGASKLPDGAALAISNTDPCAMRLHDLSGLLLMYQMEHGQLPAALSDLAGFPGFDQLGGLVCPVSGKPYVYNPNGIMLPEQNKHVIVYDPEPSHAGMRLAITIDDPRDDQPMLTRVLVLPETFFTFVSPSR